MGRRSFFLGAVLLSSAVAGHTIAPVDPENFTSDERFREYIGAYFQLRRAMALKVVDSMEGSLSAEAKPLVPSLPACAGRMRSAMDGPFFTEPLIDRLRGTSLAERRQFAGFARFLHSSDGARVLALTREALAVADQPDANGMPQLSPDRDAKLKQAKDILKRQSMPNAFQQAVVGVTMYVGAMASDPLVDRNMEAAQERVQASPACTAMKTELQAYSRVHPNR